MIDVPRFVQSQLICKTSADWLDQDLGRGSIVVTLIMIGVRPSPGDVLPTVTRGVAEVIAMAAVTTAPPGGTVAPPVTNAAPGPTTVAPGAMVSALAMDSTWATSGFCSPAG